MRYLTFPEIATDLARARKQHVVLTRDRSRHFQFHSVSNVKRKAKAVTVRTCHATPTAFTLIRLNQSQLNWLTVNAKAVWSGRHPCEVVKFGKYGELEEMIILCVLCGTPGKL